MDHWNNDTCVGKYLKTIYEQRINKNKKSYNGDRHGQFSVSQYTKNMVGNFTLISLVYLKERFLVWMVVEDKILLLILKKKE